MIYKGSAKGLMTYLRTIIEMELAVDLHEAKNEWTANLKKLSKGI